MKKCPKCKAEIQEEARFCLYCMTSFEEKQTIETPKENNKRWLIIVAAVLVFALIILSIILFIPKNNHQNGSSDTSNGTITSSEQQSNGSASEESSSPSSSSHSQNSTNNENNTTHNTPTNSSSQKNTASDSELNNTDSDGSSSNSTSETSPTNEEIEEITWYYIDAYSGDYDKRYNGIELENAIVVNGFDRIPSNGIYKIPAEIDGKTVVGIDMRFVAGYAFDDPSVCETVKKLYIPPSVNKITYNIFTNFINMTDFYIAGEFLYLEPSALAPKENRTGTLTIHTSETCWCLYGSKEFRAYCSSSGYNEYNAEHKLWDGSIYKED